MNLLASWMRGGLLLLAVWMLGGCLPSAHSQLEEEKEPHFMAGKSRISTLDYRGAIEAFEKALQVNPHSSQAHFELACLFDQKEPDPAAAIYHYEQYLRLRPNADNAEIVRQHITACKQELAKTVSLGPVTEKVEHDLLQITEQKNRLAYTNSLLAEQNKRLQEELNKWRGYAGAVQSYTNRTGTISTGMRGTSPTGGAGGVRSSMAEASASRAAVAEGWRTYNVKAGDTPVAIAKQYGIKLDALMAANPGLDPRRLKVGQAVKIPAP